MNFKKAQQRLQQEKEKLDRAIKDYDRIQSQLNKGGTLTQQAKVQNLIDGF